MRISKLTISIAAILTLIAAPYVLAEEQPAQGQVSPSVTRFSDGIVKHDLSYIPFHDIFTQLGYTVSWDGETETVTAKKNDKTIVLNASANPITVKVNGEQIGPEIVPFIHKGTTYVPLSFVTYVNGSARISRGVTMEIATPEQIIEISYKVERPENEKIAYLTFDDGPSDITPEILDVLKENDVKATFFVVGRNVQGHESILKRELEEGHVIGNHTFSHNYYSIYKNEDAFFQDFAAGEEAIEEVTGEKPTIFRFPGGSNNLVSKRAQDLNEYGKGQWVMRDIVKEAEQRGYHYFDWNASTGDAASNHYTAEDAFNNVIQSVGDGSKKEVIVLAHDSAPKENTVQALPEIIQYLQEKGYHFATLDEDTPPIRFLK